MTNQFDKIPIEIKSKILQCLHEVDGEYEVQNMKTLVDLIVEYGSKYPALYNLVNINEEALIQHYKETGEVPPGIKIVEKTKQENSNIIGLKILHGTDSKNNK